MSSKACQRRLWAWIGLEGLRSLDQTSLRLSFLTGCCGHQLRLHLANHPVSPAELSLKSQRILFQHVFDIALRNLRSLRLQYLSGELELPVRAVDEEGCDILGVYQFDEDLPHEAPPVLEVGEHLLGLCEGLDSLWSDVVDSPRSLVPGFLIGF